MERYRKIEEWFLAYGSDVHHFLAYYLGRSNVEDLVQEVFVKALKSLDRYEGRAGPKTWLIAIARRSAIDEERKRKRARLLSARLRENHEPSDPSMEEIVFQQEELNTIYRMIRKLKRSEREVLLLRVMQDFTVEETAMLLNWTKARVNLTLHRVLGKVRKQYWKQEGGMDLAAGKR